MIRLYVCISIIVVPILRYATTYNRMVRDLCAQSSHCANMPEGLPRTFSDVQVKPIIDIGNTMNI